MTDDRDLDLDVPVERLESTTDDVEGIGGRGSGGPAGTGETPGGIGTVTGGPEIDDVASEREDGTRESVREGKREGA